MPQLLVKNYIHIVFSTKNRQPFIKKEIKSELYAYLGGTCKELECHALAIGGIENHVHILCMLSQKIALMNLIRKVKAHSSKWIKTKGDAYSHFSWQNGYGAFSVSPTRINSVKNYVNNQEEHHRKRSFKEEVRLFLDKYEIKYDERYVWD
jgi:REP element-mobilizing transposase RayT